MLRYIKEIIMAKEKYVPPTKPPFDYNREFSWSQMSTFRWRPEDWYQKYVIHGECTREKDGVPSFCIIAGCSSPECPVVATSPEMTFGKEVGEKLASDPTYLPEVPRLPIFEHKLAVEFQGIPLVGYIDALCLESKQLGEYKTGRKIWDKKRADGHQQINFYLLGLYLTEKIKPEEFTCNIYWMPTHIHEGKVAFIDPFAVHTFKANRTMADVMRFGQEIIDMRKAMLEYYETHQ